MKSVAQHIDLVDVPVESFVRHVEAVAFWSAIALPFLYLPLLFTGLETTQELLAFLGLLGLNLVAFVVGHRHKR